jgi:phage terminase small subunit
MSKPLNPKQLKFVELFLATGNATQSYLAAGYQCSKRAAETSSSALLRNPEVQKALAQATAKAAEARALTVEMALSNLWAQATATGPGTSHMARVVASKELLNYFREAAKTPPPSDTSNENTDGRGSVTDRIALYTGAFAGVADRASAEWFAELVKREAEREGPGSSQASRVAALKLAGMMLGILTQKYEHSDPNGGPIPACNLALSDADLEALDAILTRATVPPAPTDPNGNSAAS